tara:strand:+ start:501 stop:794 length:294 start_codon:yes stop_codon:yes gene_type:complete
MSVKQAIKTAMYVTLATVVAGCASRRVAQDIVFLPGLPEVFSQYTYDSERTPYAALNQYEAHRVRGVTLEQFLHQADGVSYRDGHISRRDLLRMDRD